MGIPQFRPWNFGLVESTANFAAGPTISASGRSAKPTGTSTATPAIGCASGCVRSSRSRDRERNAFLTNTCTRSWDCTSLKERSGNGSCANVCELPFNPTSALWCEEPLENQGPVDFSVTMRLASLPGFYWTYDLCRHPKRLVQNPLIWLGCPATTNPQNSVLVGRQNDRRDLVLRQQVAHRPP